MSRVRYSTNMMGPWHLEWYRDKGLTKTVTKVLDKDSPWSDRKAGDVVECEEITERYAGGRIDFWNPHEDSMYPDEYGLPVMRAEDWGSFTEWLNTYETDGVVELKDLIWMYERANPKIRWWETPSWYDENYDPTKV